MENNTSPAPIDPIRAILFVAIIPSLLCLLFVLGEIFLFALHGHHWLFWAAGIIFVVFKAGELLIALIREA